MCLLKIYLRKYIIKTVKEIKQTEVKTMSKAQGDGFRTWTDVEMNKRVAEHNRKWNELIKPYYDFLVNEQEKEFELEDIEDSRIIIRTRQFNEVECTGKTRFWMGTLKKEDYRVTKTVYIITGVMIDKKTGEETYISHEVFEGKENKDKANEHFKNLKEYLG